MNIDASSSQNAINEYFETKDRQKILPIWNRKRLVIETEGDTQYLVCRTLKLKERIQALFGAGKACYSRVTSFCTDNQLTHQKFSSDIENYNTKLYHLFKTSTHASKDLKTSFDAYLVATRQFASALDTSAEAARKFLETVNPLYLQMKDMDGNSWIHLACASKNGLAALKELIKKDNNQLYFRGENGMTSLMKAAANGNLQILSHLIVSVDLSPDILAPDSSKMTLEDHIFQSGNRDCINAFLLSTYLTPLEKAVLNSNKEVIESAITRRDLRPQLDRALLLASSIGDLSMVEEILKVKQATGLSREAKDAQGRTALHCACKNGHQEVAQRLIEYNVIIDARDKRETTPLMLACENGHLELATLLLNNGARLFLGDKEGNNALHYACRRGQQNICKQFFDHLSRLPNNEYKIPLQLLSERKYIYIP